LLQDGSALFKIGCLGFVASSGSNRRSEFSMF
jgi:hypothetical protein